MDDPSNSGKKCKRCQAMLPFAEYGVNRAMRDGLQPTCKGCLRKAHSHAMVKKTERENRARHGGQPIRRREPAGEQLWCPDCEAYRPVREFFKNAAMPSGYGNYCREHQTARVVESRNRLHGGSRNYHLKRRYGITEADFQEMFEAAGGLCQGCRKSPPVHVDHDHVTQQVRGLLCFNCKPLLLGRHITG